MQFTQILENGSTQQIEQALSRRFGLNYHFFETINPRIHTLLKRPAKTYNLLVNDKGLNVYQMQTKQFIYPVAEDGTHQMVTASKQIAQSPFHNTKWKVHENNIALSKMDQSRFPQTGKIVSDLIDHVMQNEPMDTFSKHLPSRFLPTTTLIGLGGGLYLEYLMQAYERIHSLMIFDEHSDFFRISCFFVDYPKLFEMVSPKSCYLFIEEIADRKLIKHFYMTHRITSNFIRLELELYESEKTREVKAIAEAEQNANTRGWGTYEDEMVGIRNHQRNIDMNAEKLEIPVLSRAGKQNIPICVIGNGPSLDDLLPFLKENQQKMILFSSGTALKPLLAYGIKPDFQIEIERMDYLPEVLKEAGLDDVPVIGGNIVNPGVYEVAKEEYIFLRGSSAHSYTNEPNCVIEYTYPFVGNAAFSLALHFSDIVLMCGLDCGYKKGRTKHASGSMYGEEDTELPKGAVLTKGNLNDDIYTDSIFTLSRQMYELAILAYKPERVMNLSDGAFIKGARPMYPEKVELQSGGKKARIKEIKKAFSRDKQKVFNDTVPVDWNSLLKSYRDDLFKIMSRDVKDKLDFFRVMDEVTAFVQQYREENEHIGILIQGSTLHVLNTMFMIVIYTKKNDIGPLYKAMVEIFNQGFGLYVSRYSASNILSKMPKIP